MAEDISITETEKTSTDLNELVGMVHSMASFNFSKRLEFEVSEDPINVLAYGLNMLSEELEANVVKRSSLEEVNKNLEQFAYTVAHDIRSPFNSSLGLISLLEMELGDEANERVKEYLSLLKKTNERIIGMVNGILEYSKTNFNSVKKEEVNIEVLCRDLVEVYQVKRKVTLVFDTVMPVVVYNKMATQQIFGNLIDNAVKHNNKDECLLTISCADNGDCYEISIKDNGPGIDKENLDKVFDLFKQFRLNEQDSYGIGLAIVKKLVTQANGNIWAESTAGDGTKFSFTINKDASLVMPEAAAKN